MKYLLGLTLILALFTGNATAQPGGEEDEGVQPKALKILLEEEFRDQKYKEQVTLIQTKKFGIEKYDPLFVAFTRKVKIIGTNAAPTQLVVGLVASKNIKKLLLHTVAISDNSILTSLEFGSIVRELQAETLLVANVSIIKDGNGEIPPQPDSDTGTPHRHLRNNNNNGTLNIKLELCFEDENDNEYCAPMHLQVKPEKK